MRHNEIIFHAIDQYAYEVVSFPSPAKDFIPQWWKTIKPYTANNLLKSEDKAIHHPHVSVKKCSPMLDAMTSGYILPLWADVEITNVGGGKNITWGTSRDVFAHWNQEVTQGIQTPLGFDSMVFKFLNYFVIETPQGYSSLITHPHGHTDLPFRTISGVVDTDKLKTIVNPTLWLQKDFTGIIKKGTPIAQIIPFKRNNWKHKVKLMPEKQNYFNEEKFLRTVSEGAYSLFQRENKKYE